MQLRPVVFVLLACVTFACGDSGGGTDGGSGSAGSSSGVGSTGATSAASTDAPTSGGSGGASEGSSGGSSTGAGTSPWDAPPMCSSGVMWTMGEIEDPHMHPGRVCLDCHMQAVQPFIKNRFQIAGTVFPTGHEPDDCYGVDGVAAGIEVEVTDAMNQVFTMPVNEAGNFMQMGMPGSVVFPISALVRRGDLEIKMASSQNTGDCNSCHTQDGTNNALGRIVGP